MTQDSLSQQEIDALLSQRVSKTEKKDKTTPALKKVAFCYNFRKQRRISKEQFVLLESIHKKFLRNLEATLTNLLNTAILANLAAATELSYGDFTDSMSSPACLFLLNLNKDVGKFLLELDPKFASYIIEKILGGSGRDISTLNRELSLIEEKIMSRVVNMLLLDLVKAWEKVVELDPKIEGFYAQSDFVQFIGKNESVILISIDLSKADNSIGFLNLCLPSALLESFFIKYDKKSVELKHTQVQDTQTKSSIEKRIRQAILPVKVVLGKTKISVSDLLHIEEDDVLLLQKEANNSVDVYIGNMKMYKGLPVNKENSLVVKISDIIRR